MTVKDLIDVLSERQRALFHAMAGVMGDYNAWRQLYAKFEEVTALLRLLRGGNDAV